MLETRQSSIGAGRTTEPIDAAAGYTATLAAVAALNSSSPQVGVNLAVIVASMNTHHRTNGRPQTARATPANHGHPITKGFSRLSHATARAAGTPAAFLIAAITILVWAVTGPLFDYSDSWQLVINTGTTIVTFLMVFLIQNTQNRDTMALQLKLSELIIAMKGAKNSLATVEDLTEEELEELHKGLCARADAANNELSTRRKRQHGQHP